MPRRRVDLRTAAQSLDTSVDAVRKRIQRGTLDSEKGADGKVYVWLDDTLDADTPRSDTDRLISTLEEQLRLEREAHAESRRLLAAALERIPPQLEAPTAPSEPRDAPETPPGTPAPPEPETPAEARPWWRRVLSRL